VGITIRGLSIPPSPKTQVSQANRRHPTCVTDFPGKFSGSPSGSRISFLRLASTPSRRFPLALGDGQEPLAVRLGQLGRAAESPHCF
jgi:hypothetical protein